MVIYQTIFSRQIFMRTIDTFYMIKIAYSFFSRKKFPFINQMFLVFILHRFSEVITHIYVTLDTLEMRYVTHTESVGIFPFNAIRHSLVISTLTKGKMKRDPHPTLTPHTRARAYTQTHTHTHTLSRAVRKIGGFANLEFFCEKHKQTSNQYYTGYYFIYIHIKSEFIN